MFYGALDCNNLRFKFTSAGHNQGIVLRGGKLIELPAGGIALGATSNSMFSRLIEVKEISLQSGDYLIQATDGVEEAMDAHNNEFGRERFYRVLRESYGKTPEQMIDSVVQALNNFTGSIPQHDDITMIALRVL